MKTFSEIRLGASSLWFDLYSWLEEHTPDWDELSLSIRKVFVNDVETNLWEQARTGVHPQKYTPRCCYKNMAYQSPINLIDLLEEPNG